MIPASHGKGGWKVYKAYDKNQSRYADEQGAEASFMFNGTGVVIRGNWMRDGGKADVFIDGAFHRTVDAYFWWAGQEKKNVFLWHVLHLNPAAIRPKLLSNVKRNRNQRERECILPERQFLKQRKKCGKMFRYRLNESERKRPRAQRQKAQS